MSSESLVPAYCSKHPEEELHIIGYQRQRLVCRLCSTEATRAWRAANPYKRMWQTLVQKVQRKFGAHITEDMDLSWAAVGEALVQKLLGTKEATTGDSWFIAWTPSCVEFSLDQLYLKQRRVPSEQQRAAV